MRERRTMLHDEQRHQTSLNEPPHKALHDEPPHEAPHDEQQHQTAHDEPRHQTAHDEPRHQRTRVLAVHELVPDLAAIQPPEEEEPGDASLVQVLANGAFRSLWIAQICSQLAQNLTWITLGAFVEKETHAATLVSVITVSAMLAQFLLSGFAGVLVDRTSKRAILLGSNVARIVLAVLFIASTPLTVAVQTTVIIILIFIANSVAQFFAPAEAATIPLIVQKRNFVAASSLFNITFNACQVLPITLGVLFLDLTGIVPVLATVAALYVVAAVLVALLPPRTAVAPPSRTAESLRQVAHHVLIDVREALHFLARDPGLRLTIFQINVAPAFMFIFGVLGFKFVQQTFGLSPERAWILLLPAGLGLVLGALFMGRAVARVRKEDLINLGLLVMGVFVAVLGTIAVVVDLLNRAATHVGTFISEHIHQFPSGPHDIPLVPVAMVIAFVIGLAMALSTIPAQTLVFERTSEEVRGRVLSMQQLIGGAIPIIPLLTVALLADLFGTATIMTALGVVIVLIGALTVHLDRRVQAGT